MMLNRSETCATRRLSQCWGFGISMNDVSQKFYGDPEDATDLSPEDFFARKAVIEEVEKWCDEMEDKPELIYQNKWTPILYLYEVCANDCFSPTGESLTTIHITDRQIFGQARGEWVFHFEVDILRFDSATGVIWFSPTWL